MAGRALLPSPWRKRYVVAMIVFASALSYVDRQIITILVEPIKHEFQLDDTRIGLLTGLFFSAFYIIAGFPLARLADRGSRRNIIAACIGVWSAATMFCGMATSYAQLAAGRMLVATGEAGAAPASYSMLSDLYPPARRAGVFALVSCGSTIGIAFGVFLGGTLRDYFSWREVFLIVGAPGILFPILFWLTVPEPPRDIITKGLPRAPILKDLVGFFRSRSYRCLVLISFGASFSSYGILAWMPSLLIRTHGLAPGEVGKMLGLAIGSGLLLGLLCCGYISNRLGERDVRWLAWITVAGMLSCVPTGVAAIMWPTTFGAMFWLAGFNFFLGFWSPPVFTLMVGLVPGSKRALAIATVPICQSIGGALGPLMVGVLSDLMTPRFGAIGLGFALAAVLIGCLLAAIGALLASRFVVDDHAEVAKLELNRLAVPL